MQKAWLLLIPACVTAAFAQSPPTKTVETDPSGKLDRVIERFVIQDETIPQALAALGKQADVEIVCLDRDIDLLPQGRETRVKKVILEYHSLRDALPQVLGHFGMTYEVQGDTVVVVAGEPLKRINRQATWGDLKLLREVNETPYTPETLSKFTIQYRISSQVDAPRMLEHQLQRAGTGGTIAQMLELATQSLGWVWFPEEDHLVVRTQQAQIANKLSRRVYQRYDNTPLSDILVDLSNRAEVHFELEPGMMLKLPPETANSYTLLLRQTSIRQALDLICAETGLKYDIHRETVKIGLSDALRGDGGAARQRTSPYVGKLSIPGKDGSFVYEFLLREEDLPPDILEYRQALIDEYIQKMRRDLEPVESVNPAGKSEDESPE